MVPLATGSDNGGSCRTPAAFCGVVGFRPSTGVIASDRRPTAFNPLTVEGPLANSVEDAALLLCAMMGDNSADPLAWLSPTGEQARLHEVDLSDLRVAVSADLGFAPVDDSVRSVFEDRCRLLARFFCGLVESDPPLEDADRTYRILRAEGYLTAHLDTYRVNPDLLGPLVKANVEEALSYNYEDFARANAARTGIYRRFQDYFRDIDILICPTTSVAPFPVEELYPAVVNSEVMSTYMEWLGITYGLTVTGHPVLAIPCGCDRSGLPFGIQVCGPRRSDLWLLSVGMALERCFIDHPSLARPLIA
jgi:Asp-tRNA(Asn)/Glu-tRNA(Gln) amidotransferase A subunit family amidase